METCMRRRAWRTSTILSVVLNPAPAQLLTDALLDEVDIITPYRIELAQMIACPPRPCRPCPTTTWRARRSSWGRRRR